MYPMPELRIWHENVCGVKTLIHEVQPLAHCGTHRRNIVAQAVGSCSAINDDLA